MIQLGPPTRPSVPGMCVCFWPASGDLQLEGMASPVDDVSTENGADWSGDVATENGSKQLIGDDVTGREEPLWSLIGS